MRIDFKFRHCKPSDELTSYVSDHIIKLEKYELKPVRVVITFTTEKATKRVDMHVSGRDMDFHAHSEAADFISGVDLVLEKIARQLSRRKDKVQAHKGPKVS